MPTREVFSHVIPGAGLREITLYPPADAVYRRLRSEKEVSRLHKLRHLGALSHALQGARQARWDYTLVILYYTDELNIPGFNSRFRLKRAEFSSAKAALQTLALLWNSGHLPGTFAVEKGVYRYLHSVSPERPAEIFEWPFADTQLAGAVKSAANRLMHRDDYRSLARVLAVLKLLRLAQDDQDDLYRLVEGFVAPFFLDSDDGRSIQWPKLRRAFKIVRHLAYLTLDAALTGLQWAPAIPPLFQQVLATGITDLARIDATISEILSPVEKATYDSVYHNTHAREESLLVAEHVRRHLGELADPAAEVLRWLHCGLFQELKLGRRPRPGSVIPVGAITLRSHFLSLSTSPVQAEAELRDAGFSHPAVFEYRAWNSETGGARDCM